MKKYPYGVFTSYSAYYYHNLTDVIPNTMYLAAKTEMEQLLLPDKIKQIRMKDELYNLGKTEIDYEGIKINIYDKERMLIDLAIETKIKLDMTYIKKLYLIIEN